MGCLLVLASHALHLLRAVCPFLSLSSISITFPGSKALSRVCVWGSKCSPGCGTRAWRPMCPWWQQLLWMHESMCEHRQVDDAAGADHICVGTVSVCVDLCGCCVWVYVWFAGVCGRYQCVCGKQVCACARWEHTLSPAAGWTREHGAVVASPPSG